MLYLSTLPSNIPIINSLQDVHFEESTDIHLLSVLANLASSEVRQRLANDNKAYIAFYSGQPAAFGWMAMGKATIGELNHELILPVGHRYLWNFRTLQSFRGLGIYPALLAFIIKNPDPLAKYLWIMHAPENDASRKGILKAGFKYAGAVSILRNNVIIGNVTPELLPMVEDFDSGFIKSHYPEATCWMCSSPYLAHKKTECCCVKKNIVCNSGLFI